MEAIIISTIALVLAIIGLFMAMKSREEVRELRKSGENYFQEKDGIIYTKPHYKGLVSTGFITAQDARH